MDSTPIARVVQSLSLLDSLDDERRKLPLAVMRDMASAVKTLGGLAGVDAS